MPTDTHATEIPPGLARQLQERGLEAVLEPARRAGPAALGALVRDLEAVDWTMLDRQRAALLEGPPPPPEGLEPPELLPPSLQDTPENRAAAEAGWELLRRGGAALATVAGGQASRLGFEGPKGAFPLGPVSGATLFQILAGQVRRLRERAGWKIPWVIQTGPGNHADTEAFFEARSWFGLGRDRVRLVCQGTLPALSEEGGFLLAAPDRLFRNPDGHGGFYRALTRSGTLAWLREQGVEHLFYCQVDNPLVRMGDPVFLGHHLLQRADMSVKVVEKTDPAEKVGLVVRHEGHHLCVEYSDLSEEFCARRAADGGLEFRAGNIALHAFRLDFVEAMAGADLPLHLARKQVRALDGHLDPVPRPGVKFETFVFDALPRAGKVVVQLADRAEEFSPVKNREGVDSIRSSREHADARARRWMEALGLRPAAAGWTEIEPGLALDLEDLRRRRDELELACGGRLLRRRRA